MVVCSTLNERSPPHQISGNMVAHGMERVSRARRWGAMSQKDVTLINTAAVEVHKMPTQGWVHQQFHVEKVGPHGAIRFSEEISIVNGCQGGYHFIQWCHLW